MKVRDSGMPPEDMWSEFFSPEGALRSLGLDNAYGDVADFGCGYGTFAIPAARLVDGTVYALDIEEEMIAAVETKARAQDLLNIKLIQRDFMTRGSGLPDASVDAVLLLNILHAEEPVALIKEAGRILRPSGKALIMHWVADRTTPRGPSMQIRPTPDQCVSWGLEAGFSRTMGPIDLPPYHYGLTLIKD